MYDNNKEAAGGDESYKSFHGLVVKDNSRVVKKK
jgi:hypothetical protein